MVDAARRYGRVVQVGSQSRSLPSVRFGCEVVRSGRIGKVLEVHVACSGTSQDTQLPAQSVPGSLDWELWLGPAPWRPYNAEYHPVNWRRFRDFSGGDATDWGAHFFDLAQWGLGMDDTGPVEIFPPGANGYSAVSYRYANGVMMFQGGRGVTFKGTDGTVVLQPVGGRNEYNPPEIGRRPIAPEEANLTYSTANVCHTADFLDAVRTRRKPSADVEIGCRTVTVCHLTNIACWLGQSLRWDPQAEDFIDNPEASRLLSRSMREPWHL
jgi:predicted dehydrogenase